MGLEREESPMALAMKVLKAINKSVESNVQLDEVPAELCIGENLNLDRWTLILNDHNLQVMSRQPKHFHFIDASAKFVSGMFRNFWNPMHNPAGLVSISMREAKEITDYGLTLIARASPNLQHLDITGCIQIGDISIREVGMCCTELLSLIISSCHEIVGEGLVAVGETCRQLRKFSFARCRKLERFAISNVFLFCTKLEEVDASHFQNIGDDEVRTLAQSCPNLMSFLAVECSFISDQSILAISQHCPDIDVINVSRHQNTFRISDVCMLALGQRSSSLRVLNLNGCDHISDVGLTWLCEGCKALEVLDLGGCDRITDAGLRSIGEGCHSLQYLDISQAKGVSDVGITSIASGCPKIKTVKYHGLYFLADPRLSAPKKGEKVEAWQTIVGVAALAQYSLELENLDLSGCFRLNNAIKSHLSGMTTLKSLNLMGCNQIAVDAFIAIGRHCIHLEDINFSDCGKTVNGKVMETFSKFCKKIRIIHLARLPNIKSTAMKAISEFDNLEKLDLTGCDSLTDIMLLPITELGKVDELRSLSIVNVTRATDATLSWVANGCPNLLTFAFKGTSITKPSVSAVRDRFPWCDMVYNDNFNGFWPKSRIDDKKVINAYCRMVKGIVLLQGRARILIAKRIVSQVVSVRRRLAASYLIVSCVRIAIAKKKVRKEREKLRKIDRAARLVTSILRIPVAKARVRRMVEYNKFLFKNKKAEIIQRCWRAHFDWVQIKAWSLEYFAYLRFRYKAAIKMQSIARMYFKGIKVRKLEWEHIFATRALRIRKSIEVQRCFRGHLARVEAEALRERRDYIARMRLIATLRIQRSFRRHVTNEKVKRGTARRKRYAKCVVMIQAVVRGALTRLFVAEMLADQEDVQTSWGALKIQTQWRVKKARLIVAQLRREREELLRLQSAAVTVFSKSWRRRIARLELKRLKKEHFERLKNRAEAFVGSAIKIQALWRGGQGRTSFDEKLREKKGKWKELFDEEKRRRFFYNKLTGEIRWRMPQDLLDLIPRPQCDNCNFYEGALECAVCNEIYCNQCFSQVHYGGRRKDHEFRSIYDFYGKRMDYGDGVFPCKWPTEVIQDEVQGWMLRVAPIRDPVGQYGEWEQYEDAPGVREGAQYLGANPRNPVGHRSSKGVSAGESRTFYFNRKTFEATYDVPDAIIEANNAREAAEQAAAIEAAKAEYGGLGYYDTNGNWIDCTNGEYGSGYGGYQSGQWGQWEQGSSRGWGDFNDSSRSAEFSSNGRSLQWAQITQGSPPAIHSQSSMRKSKSSNSDGNLLSWQQTVDEDDERKFSKSRRGTLSRKSGTRGSKSSKRKSSSDKGSFIMTPSTSFQSRTFEDPSGPAFDIDALAKQVNSEYVEHSELSTSEYLQSGQALEDAKKQAKEAAAKAAAQAAAVTAAAVNKISNAFSGVGGLFGVKSNNGNNSGNDNLDVVGGNSEISGSNAADSAEDDDSLSTSHASIPSVPLLVGENKGKRRSSMFGGLFGGGSK